ncbi:MAG: protein kinase [Planctomycetes bacterium]|nr:protein kinase [Planctomycetota bacterium]
MNDQHPLLTEDSGTPTRPTRPAGDTAAPATTAAAAATAATQIAGTGSAAATQVADLNPSSAPGTAPTVVAGSPPVADLPAGTPREIGGVHLVRVLGKGAMGEVYLGRHRTMDIDVAVKLMMERPGNDADRFLQEVRAAARISHAHVIQVMNAGVEQGRLFLVMELVTGGDVSQLIKREGRLPWRRAVDLAIQAAEGLGAAHRAGIVHRDVKPANFLLTGDGKLKVADLGMAKRQQSGDVELTQSGVIMGTPAYMAPEQAIDTRRAGPPADVYALGVALFHLLCGRLPFQAETSNAMLLAHANQPVPDVRTLAADVPEDVVGLVTRLLDKEPSKRPVDGNAAAAELRAVLAAHPDGVAVKRAGVPIGVIVIAAMVIAGVLGFVLTRPWSSAPTTTTTTVTADIMPPSTTTATTSAVPAAAAPSDVKTIATSVVKPPALAIDPWQSPTRAVFVLSGDPQSIDAATIESALITAKVLLVERAVLDQAVLKEVTLAQNGQVDVASAVRAGKLVGGHVALLVRRADDKLALRSVLIETGELVGSQVVLPTAAGETATTLVTAALSMLPAQGRLSREPDNTWVISLGRQHGLSLDDRFKVLAGDVAAPGSPVAVATIERVGATSATVTVAGTPPQNLPALVTRIAQ